MCTLYKRSSKFNRIDSQQLQKREHKELYWRTVLKRIISTIKILSRLGVAFRGHDEGQKSTRTGNYLTCLDYLSEYDDFLKLKPSKIRQSRTRQCPVPPNLRQIYKHYWETSKSP
ncbi:hypothetical protein TNCT_23341 [Trichonephila clavata]|uniref:DUF4371 domain-containing protein n=1 Tax=Trichonephila clavata TaxID=2740835 RepID=A0A8X6I363_TRICU|nr:hypothetical protein TNCT_23341 [Trichonephila clavata]